MISGVNSSSNSFVKPKPSQAISKPEEGCESSCAATCYIHKEGFDTFLSVQS